MVANIRMIINSSVNTQTKIHTGLLLLFLIKQTVNFMWEKKASKKNQANFENKE